MEIRKTYKFEYEKDGKILYGVSTGFLPDYATKVLEEINVLYPAKDMMLKRVDGEELFRYVILKDNDIQENYIEVEKPEEERPERIRPNADR